MSLKIAIINTLNYSALFNYPLTKKEIHNYLISPKKYSYSLTVKTIDSLVISKKIYVTNTFYSSKKIDKSALVNKQLSIKKYKKIFNKVKKDLSVFNKLFFIKFIGITGSVAAKDLKSYYDIDLFFICQKNFVWVSRLFVVLYLKFKKMYKSPYCANIYISTSALGWEDKNVYIANEISRLKPVFNKNDTYENFISKNRWVLKYLANFKIKKSTNFKTKKFIDLLSYLIFPVEFLLFFSEYLYMLPKISTEKISFNKILFFKKDYSKKILKNTNNTFIKV